jgi:hypothetical protein
MDNLTTQNVGVNTSVLQVYKHLAAVLAPHMWMRMHLLLRPGLHSKWQHLHLQVTLMKMTLLQQPHQWPVLQKAVKMPRISWP